MQYIGEGKGVIVETSAHVDLHVYPACDQTTCDIAAVYRGSSSSGEVGEVAWTAVSRVEYLLLVTTKESSSSSTVPEFELRILTTNDSCDKAVGLIRPEVDSFLSKSGSISASAIVNPSSACGLDFSTSTTGPGAWYTIVGNGDTITASTCAGTDFDSQIFVFIGGSCSRRQCVAGNDDAKLCGKQSRVAIQSIQDQTYYVVVHGYGGATGNFALQISWEYCGLQIQILQPAQILESDGIPRSVIIADAKWDADLPELPDSPGCFSSPEDLPSHGLWYRIVGTGNLMSVLLDSSTLDPTLDLSGTRISVLSGIRPGCSNLFCVVTDCVDTCAWESTADQVYFIFITFIDSSFKKFMDSLRNDNLSLTSCDTMTAFCLSGLSRNP
jgi:hypothetical protein